MATPAINTRNIIANLPLFRELAAEELERIADHAKAVRVDKGAILFQRGQPSQGFYAVVFGQIKLSFISKAGNEKVVDLLGPGQSFGEAVMFMERPHVVTAQALADSMLLFIAKSAVFEELEKDPRFARRMIAGLSQRLHYLLEDLEGYSMRSGMQRVIGFLLREDAGSPLGDEPLEVMLPAAKGVIASRLNLTQEHFSRILHDLAAKGLIEVRGRTIVVPRPGRLQTFEP